MNLTSAPLPLSARNRTLQSGRRSSKPYRHRINGNTILNAGIEYGKIFSIMNTARKITVEVPEDLLEKAQQASGASITQTVRTGLQLVAASRTYERLLQFRGKVKFSRTAAELKDDR
jgi:hypothetical protein